MLCIGIFLLLNFDLNYLKFIGNVISVNAEYFQIQYFSHIRLYLQYS